MQKIFTIKFNQEELDRLEELKIILNQKTKSKVIKQLIKHCKL